MTRRKLFGFSLVCAALGIALSMPHATTAQPKDAPIKLGMAKTFFNDLPAVIISIVTDPFSQLLKETTGLDGKLSFADDAFGTAAKLDSNELQFGVFHGHEFAWVQKKYPKLQPLMVVVNKQHDVRQFVIVPMNSPAKSIADLRGKKLDMPIGTKEHCRVFLGKKCGDNAQSDLKSFFGAIVKSETYINGLDDLCKGTNDAVLIDSIALAFYKDIKLPVFSKNLRVLEQSDEFPSAMIAYKVGGISDATVTQFRDGLLKAHQNAVGKEMMGMWGIEAFETPPATFTKSLANSLIAYPAPR